MNKSWYSLIILSAFGIIGALGQAAYLHNDLVHSYPYKMMGKPPAAFYSAIGEIGYYIAILAAVMGVVASPKQRRLFTALLPVLFCPLAYWIVFIVGHLFSGFGNEQMTARNFESATGYSNILDFTVASALLLISGTVIALLISFSLLKAEAIWTRRAETRV